MTAGVRTPGSGAADTGADAEAHGRASFRGILRSTSLVGWATGVTVLVGLARAKVVAVLLGPEGIGLLGVFGQLSAVLTTVFGLGLGGSGVRLVAQASASGAGPTLSRAVGLLRRASWVAGLAGTLLVAAFARPLSHLTFGDGLLARPIAILSLAVLFGVVASAEAGVLRGTQRVAEVAWVTVAGSLAGLALGLPCLLAWGREGIAPALVAGSAASYLATRARARRVTPATARPGWRDGWGETRALAGLGVSLMVSSLAGTIGAYLVQLVLVDQFGVAGAGLYQAAYGLSGALAGFVLGAMGVEYYPRIAALGDDREAIRRAVDQQTQVSTLLALPGLSAVMVLAPALVHVFYGAEFHSAVPMLRWMVLGVLGRVCAWPLGYVLLAMGRGRLFLLTEVLGSGLHLLGVAVLAPAHGLLGASQAFLLTYLLYTALLLAVVGRLIGRPWSGRTARVNGLAALVLGLLALAEALAPPPAVRWGIDLAVVAAVAVACVHQLARRARGTRP